MGGSFYWRTSMRKNTSQDFWERVDKSRVDGCWEWNGRRHEDGYGEIDWHGKTKKAHRVAYELTFGSIPQGMNVCHRCDNPPCCNPAHLFLGTQSENIQDMDNKGRRNSKYPVHRGEKHPFHKLSIAKVSEIRKRYASGEITQSELGEEYGVDNSCVSRIVRNLAWKSS